MKWKKIVLSIFFITLIGCSKKIEVIKKEDIIVAFGDSLTLGYGVSIEKSYPEQLKKLTGYNIFNAGKNGDTAQNGKWRIKEVINEYHPNIVILSLGGNDMLKKNTLNLKEDLQTIISTLKQNNIKIILLAEPQPSTLGLTFGLSDAKVYKELANENDLLLLNNIFSKYLSKEEFKSDLMHLNEKGYYLVAKDINEKFKKTGLIK